MKKIKASDITRDQWAQIDLLKTQWIEDTTKQHNHAEVTEIAHEMYAAMGENPPIVLQARSPVEMVLWSAAVSEWMKNTEQLGSQLRSQLYSQLGSQLGSQLRSQLGSQPRYVGCWWRAWSGVYAGGEILGVKFDAEKMNLFTRFNDRCSIWCAYKGLFVSSQNPQAINWQEGQLHCDDGPSVRFSDGYSVWSLGGVRVDEQIVLHGQTQTVKQIGDEQNAEIKRLRIERFAGTTDPFDGWNRYRRETNAKEIDDRYNDAEGTYETLYQFPSKEKVLMPTCRTGRMFALEVPQEIQTCEQAQDWFWNSGGSRWGKTNCIGRS